jgi:hypothetical protein
VAVGGGGAVSAVVGAASARGGNGGAATREGEEGRRRRRKGGGRATGGRAPRGGRAVILDPGVRVGIAAAPRMARISWRLFVGGVAFLRTNEERLALLCFCFRLRARARSSLMMWTICAGADEEGGRGCVRGNVI